MLRAIIGIAAVCFVGIALAGTMLHPAGWPTLAVALLFAAGCLFERRYQAGRAPDARFRPTGERFVDPETGRPTVVWADPASGERRYVDESEPPPPRC